MLLFWSGGLAATASFTLSDTINLTATEGLFDTLSIDCEDLASLTADEVSAQNPLLFQGDTCSLHLFEGIGASVSTAPIAQSLSDTVSITVTEDLMEFNSFTVTDTASITVTDVVASVQTSLQALTDTANISTVDQFSADIGVPVTVAVSFDDTVRLRSFDVLVPLIHSEAQIKHITFTAKPDHISFST